MDQINDFLHEVPDDIQNILDRNTDILAKWDTLTQLAQNEWICWITIPKKLETREKRLVRFWEGLLAGKKRPCCWPGCPHRNLKSQKFFK